MPASPVHHTPVDKDSVWDGPAAEKKFDKKVGDFVKFYAWIDEGSSDSDADGTDKEDGWGPHHDVDATGAPGDANLKGVEAAMAALNGAHGTDSRIPDGDRQAVWDHLAAHYEDAGIAKKDIPELKSSEAAVSARSQTKSRARRSADLPLGGRATRYQEANFEVREGAAGSDVPSDLVEITGLVIRYGVPYTVYDFFGEFQETIHFGACRDLLASPDLDARFLFGHEGWPMARTNADASLELTETPEGLAVRALVPISMPHAQNLVEALRYKTLTQMSVGMEVDPDADVWSGEDEWGMPNVRNIYRLLNVFDASVVTYPASPTTTAQLNERELALRITSLPPEVTKRTQRIWDLAKAGRAGVISQAESDDLLAVLRHIHAAAESGREAVGGGSEGRNAPTPQDAGILSAIATAHKTVSDAISAQAGDSDANSDPLDDEVMNHLLAAQEALTSALQSQSQDGAPDDTSDDEDRDADEYQPDADGTNISGNNAPGIGNEDGTGSRQAVMGTVKRVDTDLDLMRLRRKSFCNS